MTLVTCGIQQKATKSHIIQLKQLNEYPFDIDFQVFEVGEDGLEQAHVNSLERNGAVWHKSCRNKIDNQKVKRAKKKADKAIHTSPRKTKRMSLPCDGNSSFTSTSQNCDDGPTADDSMSEELCIICDQPGGKKIKYKAATLGIDNKVRASAETLCDKDLIRKLSSGDMIAIDANYHLTCLADLYRRSQKFEKNKKKKLDDRSKILQYHNSNRLLGIFQCPPEGLAMIKTKLQGGYSPEDGCVVCPEACGEPSNGFFTNLREQNFSLIHLYV
ncbi:hypothetical protein RRG08_013601 [Elysia crispata]|uniref:Uncharacterized protein n=1 Tax=Elysia crispata TaxID=231223 RepID=A0AAE1A8R1_9GAST|nr:hypothetical protein RRG08_013601 [Elysia crispata]